MQEAKDPKSAETSNTMSEVESHEPDSDATSTDTLSDIEEKEQVTTATPDESPEPNAMPSPDGAFDEDRGGREDVGPM